MKKEYSLISLCLLIFFVSCKKNDNGNLMTQISGKWETGLVKNHLYFPAIGIDTDEIYPNRNGNYVDFQDNDTAYYIYNSMNATGKSPYKILNRKTLLLASDTFQILSIDTRKFTIYRKKVYPQNYFEQWITYDR